VFFESVAFRGRHLAEEIPFYRESADSLIVVHTFVNP
jgi:hypothetical protein